jgi:hypothetical protein
MMEVSMAYSTPDYSSWETQNGYPLTAVDDVPDVRDFPYQPTLEKLRDTMAPDRRAIEILNQGAEGSCTGFGLAAVINQLNHNRNNLNDNHSRFLVSERMLYEMARKFDEWPGEDYAGSSCRGAIRGWFNMGVCNKIMWPYEVNNPEQLTRPRAKDARNNTIGAYYRVNKRISDMHAALNEAGALYVSAQVHDGWNSGAIADSEDRMTIPFKPDDETTGGHAFALVGYDEKGFWVQNSWGADWGDGGVARWTYEDWQANGRDAWVLQLALATPQIWHQPQRRPGDTADREGLFGSPNRSDIDGHFVHVDDGQFKNGGRYWSDLDDVLETVTDVTPKIGTEVNHLLFYAHGGLNSPKDSANRIRALKDVFLANGIYPYHFMYDTGLMEELKDVILGRGKKVRERSGGLMDWWDRSIERAARPIGRKLWAEMKQGAKSPFDTGNAGDQVLNAFRPIMGNPNTRNGLTVHVAGHSTGAILQAHLLNRLAINCPELRVASCTLMAPAATTALFESHYLPLLSDQGFGIDQLNMYNLNGNRELDDHVAHVYRKSLLYLVSNAFEDRRGESILGMEKFAFPLPGSVNKYVSGGDEQNTHSKSHGGFDNDVATMNHMLETIVGVGNIQRRFTKKDLDY